MSLGDQVCEINTLTGEIFFNCKSSVLRPKTFQLFLLLASKPETVFSKAEILASVWQGAVVEEQVIFQSINEIRKVLGKADVIKTYPRRGYSLGIAISVVEQARAVNDAKQTTGPDFKTLQKFIMPLLVTLLILVGATWAYLASSPVAVKPEIRAQEKSLEAINKAPIKKALSHKGILILPFNVSALPDSQQWLRYGGMEGVIKKVLPNNEVTIFHLEDAIEILNRIPVGQRSHIDNIFARSGASYILETSVSGTPGELIFVYSIYSRTNSRTSRATNTINVTNHEDALSEIVNGLEQSLDQRLVYDAGKFDRTLQNDLISKAVQFLEVDDYASALTFLKGAVINEPNNMTALYFLVKTKMRIGEIEDALDASNKALALIENGSDDEYKARLLYFKSVAQFGMGKLKLAEQNILAANKLARDNKDWLYYAYSQSMLGTFYQTQQDYDRAYELLSSALEYQELLNCPLGITQGHVDLGDYYLAIGDKAQAEQSAVKAKTLVQGKNLTKALPLLKRLQDKIADF